MVNEQISQKMDKVGGEVPKHPTAIPVDFQTFLGLQNYYKKHPPKPRGDKSRFLGTSDRFPKSTSELWKSTVEKHNKAGLKPLDEKKPPFPGPGKYRITEVWEGKEIKGKKGRSVSSKPERGDRLLKMISKGPSFSIYHSHR